MIHLHILLFFFRVRSEGLGRLVWFLTNEEGSHQKRPSFDELDVSNLANLFVTDQQKNLADEDTGRSVFNVGFLLCM